jgi:hypothetical protein
LHHALRRAGDQAGVAAENDEAVAAGDHRARVVGRERDAAEGHLAVGEDLRLGASDDLTQPRMVELAGHAEALREIAAGHRDDVEAVDGQDVVERVDAGRRLD